MVIFESAFVEIMMGVLTSMNPLAVSFSAMAASRRERSCL